MNARATVSPEERTVIVHVPMTFRKHGGRKQVVTPDGEPWSARPRVDNAMVKALARAFRWRRMLDEGVHATIEELAQRERVNRGYLSRVLRLTLLAPDVVEAILDGRQPEGMRLEDLLARFSEEWEEQRRWLKCKHETRVQGGLLMPGLSVAQHDSSVPAMTTTLEALPTPCLILDEAKMMRNIARIQGRLAGAGVRYRAHLKTAKSVDVARRQMLDPSGPAMVSTLREAEVFADAGVTDLIYGVGLAPQKLGRVLALRARGVDLAVILDSVAQAEAVAAASSPDLPLAALIEIDCDGHRSGVKPDDAALLLAIASALAPAAELRGVLTHGGESYAARGRAELETAAEGERRAVVRAAEILRAAGHACPVVSAGSTPTLMSAVRFDGLTEFRAGVSVFFDLFQAGVGVCGIDEIALSVLATVIGHQPEKGWTITDAGWMAMSRDRGTATQAVDQGYGLVCALDGTPIPDLIVVAANQEHGVVAPRSGSGAPAPDLPVGTRLRVLPNHACATAAQYDRYHVLRDGVVDAEWSRFGGW